MSPDTKATVAALKAMSNQIRAQEPKFNDDLIKDILAELKPGRGLTATKLDYVHDSSDESDADSDDAEEPDDEEELQEAEEDLSVKTRSPGQKVEANPISSFVNGSSKTASE